LFHFVCNEIEWKRNGTKKKPNNKKKKDTPWNRMAWIKPTENWDLMVNFLIISYTSSFHYKIWGTNGMSAFFLSFIQLQAKCKEARELNKGKRKNTRSFTSFFHSVLLFRSNGRRASLIRSSFFPYPSFTHSTCER